MTTDIKYRRDLWQALSVRGDGAEIGVAEGNFSEDLLRWPVRFPRFYLVDRWRHVPGMRGDSNNSQEWHDANYAQVLERMKPFGRRVVILRGNSASVCCDVPDRSLAFCNIDADHSYRGVMQDLECWVPKVMPGGIVALHDYENANYGVKQAVTEYCHSQVLEVRLLPEDKPEDAGAWFYVP